MRNVIYSIGIASFLACMIFTVATSLTNPFYGMSEAALAQATTKTSTTGTTSPYVDPNTTAYSINPYRWWVDRPSEATLTYSKKGKRTVKKGGLGVDLKVVSAKGEETKLPEEESSQLKMILKNNPTICRDGGPMECYKSSDGPTRFY